MKNEFYLFNGLLYEYNGQEFKRNTDQFDIPPTSVGLILTDEVERRVKYIQGRILTVVEAVIADREQRIATKSILNQIISNELNSLSDSATGFQSLSEGDMCQFSGSPEKFYEDNVTPHRLKD